MKRQVPKWHELSPLLQFQKPILNPTSRRLARAHTIWDLRRIAKRRTPAAPFDYTDGSAEAELSLRRIRQAYRDVTFHPHILRDVSQIDGTTTVLGQDSALPFGLAPTGFTRMMGAVGEPAVARAAAQAGIPYALSTLGTTTVEDMVAAAPHGTNWFQLYMFRDREKSMGLMHRAAAAGVKTLLLTVDTPVAGMRLRDVRNGMTLPPSITLKTVLDASYRPAWWLNFLTTEPLEFASLTSFEGTVAELLDATFDPTLTFEDLAWLRSQWDGTLVVKGVQNVSDAVACAEAGADAILLSNHGGRQLDQAPIPFLLVPQVRKEVGDAVEIHVDSGIMHGSDIVTALALGADFAYVGRAYLYGLMAGGQAGVSRAIEILRSQLLRTMQLLGVERVDQLNPDHVSLMSAASSR